MLKKPWGGGGGGHPNIPFVQEGLIDHHGSKKHYTRHTLARQF